jgi:hypothetical protein
VANLVVGYGDRVPTGTVTASSSVATLPAVNLQHPFLTPYRWRSTGNTASLLLDMGGTYGIGGTALFGTNLSATASWRIRLSSASNLSSPAYDTGGTQINAGVDTTYGAAIKIFPTQTSGRYLGIDITDASLSYIEAGRWWAGITWQPSRNYAFDAQRGGRDTSRHTLSDSGQTWVDRGVVQRLWKLTLPAITPTERDQHLENLVRTVGRSEDILVVLDPNSTNLGRDSIFGLVEEDIVGTHRRHNVHSTSLVIAERK